MGAGTRATDPGSPGGGDRRGPAAGLFTGRAIAGPPAGDGDAAAVPGVPDDSRAPGGRLRRAGRYLTQGLRLMVGVPDYDTYVAHMRSQHPDREPMSYEAFFRNRQDARYGGGTGRCC